MYEYIVCFITDALRLQKVGLGHSRDGQDSVVAVKIRIPTMEFLVGQEPSSN